MRRQADEVVRFPGKFLRNIYAKFALFPFTCIPSET